MSKFSVPMTDELADQVRLFFPYAMTKGGFVSGSNQQPGIFPGWTQYTFSEERMTLVDTWGKDTRSKEKNAARGFTTISVQGITVWKMVYWGRYDKGVISFLMGILKNAYIDGNFMGCRGYPFVQSDDLSLLYVNRMRPGSTFGEFKGREFITKVKEAEPCGYHKYRGGWVFPVQ